jgi:hypothetical protein
MAGCVAEFTGFSVAHWGNQASECEDDARMCARATNGSGARGRPRGFSGPVARHDLALRRVVQSSAVDLCGMTLIRAKAR